MSGARREVLAIGLAVAAICAGGYFLAPRSVTPAEGETSARRWADKLGMRITGAQCEGNGACVVVTLEGRPVRLWCGRESCGLRGEP